PSMHRTWYNRHHVRSRCEKRRAIMSRKKEVGTQLSTAENDQVQHLLERYHAIAERLHTSAEQAQAEDALNDINELSEQAQMALLKSLSKEHDSDAADIVAGMNALSPNKEVRKEARRSLIRLEATKTYPHWTPPITRAPAVQVNVANPPRFWKSWATQTREEGEMELVLCWEQGYDYSEARLLVFQLDYWKEGVKEVLVDLGSKRRIDEYIETMRAQMAQIPKVACTLAEARRLVEDALSINSSIRDNLARDEWIAQRRAWADEAHPAHLELGFVRERERSQSALWLPAPTVGSRPATRKEVELGWSLELLDTPLSGT